MSDYSNSSPNPTPEQLVVGEPASKTPLLKRPRGHKKLILIIAGTVGAAAVAGLLGWSLAKPKPEVATKTKTTATPTPVPTPVTKIAALTGVPVEPGLADRPITGVMIENSPEARPQSGLSQAGVVYEANAEGGITRFLAMYQDQRPATIGPVRSLRPYYMDWALELDAWVSHAGGSATALGLIGPLSLKTANALSFASSGFYRTKDRPAPHNLYTDSDRLDALMARLGYNKPPNFVPSPRKADSPNPAAPHPNIHIEYSYALFSVDYKYDPNSNDYGRLLAGVPHVDRNSGKQIRVKNIVIEMMPTTTLGDGHLQMATVGRGQGWVLRDGDAIAVTWVKDSHNARTKLLDAGGNDVPLNPGNTWYSIVPVGKNVTF